MLLWKQYIQEIVVVENHDGMFVGKALSYFCVYSLYALWFVTQYYLFVVLLNFLIAILSESYNDMIFRKLEKVYDLKSELNRQRLMESEAWGKKS